jgi:2-oxoglutarate dehydrogenase E2 component (dihydrolipoamide succinyltransferase)
MPQLGETVTEGTITKWLKAIGERVERDEPLFEVSTDKVDSEVPSPVTGVLTQILVKEGDTVDVGARLAVIGDGASAVADGADAAATAAPAPPEPPPAPAPPAPRSPAPPIAPAAPPVAAPPPGPVAPRVAAGASEVLSPMVRRLIDDHGLDATSLTGTGIGGRITREDVEAAIAGASSATAPTAPAPPVAVPAAPAPTAPAAAPAPMPAPIPVRAGADRDEVVPFTNIRRRTAEHMVRSKATSPHTLMVKEIDYERVEQVRRAHGERFRAEEGFGLSYLPFAARATVEALGDFPHLNASVGDDALVVHRDINLGIAVDLDNEGLIVPVVHRAEELTLRGMARRIRELADRARSRRLSADDISGGTFSITNAGPFGTLLTGAIINQPQVAILSTDGISRKPVVVALPDGTESIAIHSVGLAAVNFDHRAVDGAYVARFLSRVAEILDQRDWAGEL